MRPFFGPTVERPATGYQIAQTMRGEIMGTMGEEPLGRGKLGVTSGFLTEFANETVPMIPAMRNLRIIRQWAGVVDRTPDGKPAVGALEDGVYITCGYSEYGITLAPAVGELLANEISGGTRSPLLKAYDPNRFG
jgi:sarcosine oxidase subunit beta